MNTLITYLLSTDYKEKVENRKVESIITFTNMNYELVTLLENLGWWKPVTITIYDENLCKIVRKSKSLNFLEDLEHISLENEN